MSQSKLLKMAWVGKKLVVTAKNLELTLIKNISKKF